MLTKIIHNRTEELLLKNHIPNWHPNIGESIHLHNADTDPETLYIIVDIIYNVHKVFGGFNHQTTKSIYVLDEETFSQEDEETYTFERNDFDGDAYIDTETDEEWDDVTESDIDFH